MRVLSGWAAVVMAVLGVWWVCRAARIFGVETIRTPTDSAEVHWRWGAVRKVLIDLDQDGTFDLEGHFEDWTGGFSPDEQFDYAFASSRCDGEFDTKMVYDPQESLYGPPGTYEAIYFDSNGDGVSEQHSPAEGLRWMAERCQLWTDHLDQYLHHAAPDPTSSVPDEVSPSVSRGKVLWADRPKRHELPRKKTVHVLFWLRPAYQDQRGVQDFPQGQDPPEDFDLEDARGAGSYLPETSALSYRDGSGW
ncbi:MAG: hypothetical protein AAF481_18870 [Acidobacteriota bacterium]